MASVFQRKGSDVWVAAFRAWDAVKADWIWRQKSTGVTDRATAAGIAATLERGSGEAKAGTLNREKALEMVNDLLRMAGLQCLQEAPRLESVAKAFLDDTEASIEPSTARRYRGQWATLKKWAGKRIELGVDAWTGDDMAKYYKWLKDEFSGTTANGHLNFCSMLFGRAVDLGYRANNPTVLVKRIENGTVTKETISRKQCADLYRVMRKNKALDWTALLGLGWHTGHRIQDLLDVQPSQLTHDAELGWLLTFLPKKTRRKGRTIVLPVPKWLALRVRKLGGFKSIRGGVNRSGKISASFIVWMRAAGIDPCPIKRGPRVVHLRSFHSLRHSMTTRLMSAGVSGELARLVTAHKSPAVQRSYVHAEVRALKEALKLARARKG